MSANSLSRIVHEKRDNCSASAHDTRRAYEAYGCRCQKAREAESEGRRKYFLDHADEIRAKCRDRARRKADAENPNRRRRSGRPRYDELEELADWVVAQRIIEHGPQPGATDPDKWLAIEILTGKGELSPYAIAKRVGCTGDTVQRFQSWLKEGKKDGGNPQVG